MGPRIVTWNVNGIRNPFSYEPWRSKRTFASMFDLLEADIVIFQETKIQRKDLRDDMVLIPGWDCYFSLPRREKGKFGVVIYTRQSTCAPIRAEEGLSGTLTSPASSTPFCELPEEKQIGGYPSQAQLEKAPDAPDIAADFDLLDSEGRCVILEFPAFVLFGVYAPATRDESRAPFKTAYMNLLDVRIRNLIRMGKRVVLTGDLNISKEALDVANIEADLKKSGSTLEEYFGTGVRRMFNHLVYHGNVREPRDEGRQDQVLWDVCRSFHPTREGMYTHWETKINARPANYGSRIDYILCSLEMKDWFSDSNIQEGLHGSDHCPVFSVMKDKIELGGQEMHTLDMMNPPGMFQDGKRLRDHTQKDILPLSGRMIPDFTGRQSIRDMFARKPSSKPYDSFESRNTGDVSDTTSAAQGTESALGSIDETLSPATAEGDDGKGSQTSSFSSSGQAKRPVTVSAKRPPSEKSSSSTSRPAKKTRPSGSGSGTSATSPAKGQQSQISGFFKPKQPKPAASGPSESQSADPQTAADAEGDDSAPLSTGPTLAATLDQRDDGFDEGETYRHDPQATPDRTRWSSAIADQGGGRSGEGKVEASDATMDPMRDLEESREGWAKLFSKPQVPTCEHNEPCKLMLSKKQGPNYLRSFYMCARPLGPSGDKERGTQWRCRTFVWLK